MSDQTPTERRKDILTTIEALIEEYVKSWEEQGYSETIVSSWYVVCEAVDPTNHRSIVEITDARSSRYTKIGLLWAALNDPRWFPRENDE